MSGFADTFSPRARSVVELCFARNSLIGVRFAVPHQRFLLYTRPMYGRYAAAALAASLFVGAHAQVSIAHALQMRMRRSGPLPSAPAGG